MSTSEWEGMPQHCNQATFTRVVIVAGAAKRRNWQHFTEPLLRKPGGVLNCSSDQLSRRRRAVRTSLINAAEASLIGCGPGSARLHLPSRCGALDDNVEWVGFE
jgi:hypothetical protein